MQLVSFERKWLSRHQLLVLTSFYSNKKHTFTVLFWFELAMADIVVVEKQKQTRRSFTREFKLSVIEWYYNNDNNILQTASKFKGDRKQIRNWIAERRKY